MPNLLADPNSSLLKFWLQSIQNMYLVPVWPKMSSPDCMCSNAYLQAFPPVNHYLISVLYMTWFACLTTCIHLTNIMLNKKSLTEIQNLGDSVYMFQNKESWKSAFDLKTLVPLGQEEGVVSTLLSTKGVLGSKEHLISWSVGIMCGW